MGTSIAAGSQSGTNVKHYKLSGVLDEITSTVTKLEYAWVIRSTRSPFSNLVGPVKKSKGIWEMTVDCRELNIVILPIHAVVPM